MQLTDLANAFTVPVGKDHHMQLAFIWQSSNGSDIAHPGEIYVDNNIPLLSYDRGTSTLQPCVIIWSARTLIALPFHRTSPCFITWMIVSLWGHGEQKVATILDILIRYLCARRWEINPKEIQGPATLVKVLWVQLSEIWRDFSSKMKGQVAAFGFPYHQERGTMPTGLLWILEATHISSGCAALTHLLNDLKSCLFWMNPRISVGSATGQAAMQAVLLTGPYDSEDMIVLEVLVVPRMLFGAIGRPHPIGESQHKHLEFFSEAILSPFERQFTACYWAFVETKCLPMSDQLTVWPEMFIMNWVCLTHQTIKLGMHCITPSSKERTIYDIGFKEVLKAQINCKMK